MAAGADCIDSAPDTLEVEPEVDRELRGRKGPYLTYWIKLLEQACSLWRGMSTSVVVAPILLAGEGSSAFAHLGGTEGLPDLGWGAAGPVRSVVAVLVERGEEVLALDQLANDCRPPRRRTGASLS